MDPAPLFRKSCTDETLLVAEAAVSIAARDHLPKLSSN